MYLPEHFAVKDQSRIVQVIHDYPLASVVYHDQRGIQAEPVPCLYLPNQQEKWGRLFFHVAAGNPLATYATQPDAQALVLFQGPSAYITPSWYEEKAVSGEVVPTYNYAVVQVQGKLSVIREPQKFLDRLSQLSAHFESARNQPWQVSDAPAPFIENLMQAIVGIELDITQVEAKFKLSQNKSLINQHNIAEGLAREQEQAVSQLMTQQLFAD